MSIRAYLTYYMPHPFLRKPWRHDDVLRAIQILGRT